MDSTNTRTWGNYILETRVEYGAAAQKNRGRYSGTKTHKLYSEYIVGVVDEAAEKALGYSTLGKRFLRDSKPVLLACRPCCGCCQGQMGGSPISSKTENDITCEKCKSRI